MKMKRTDQASAFTTLSRAVKPFHTLSEQGEKLLDRRHPPFGETHPRKKYGQHSSQSAEEPVRSVKHGDSDTFFSLWQI